MHVMLEASGGVRRDEHTIRIAVNEPAFGRACRNCKGECCTRIERDTDMLELQGLKLMRVLTMAISAEQFTAFVNAYELYHNRGGTALDTAIEAAENRRDNDAYTD